MATSAKKNKTGTGAVTPTVGTGKVSANPPAGKNGTYKDHYAAPHQNGGTAPTTHGAGKQPKKAAGKGPAGGPADTPVDAGAGSLQPGGKKGGGKRFTSIKELRDYANKQGYGN